MIVFLFLVGLSFLSTDAQADALAEIDRAVQEVLASVEDRVPDEESVTLSVGAFLSDRSGENLLGQRIKASIELALATTFLKTRITPAGTGDRHFAISGTIQPFQNTIRLIVRIVRDDDSLVGGTIVDIESDAELASLLLPASLLSAPVAERDTVPPRIEDPYEPDDNPGFEIEVPDGSVSTFERTITLGDTDRFIFHIEETKSLVVQTFTAIDTRVSLYYEGEAEPFAVNDDANDDGASRLEIELSAGVYVAEVTGYDQLTAGPYRILVNLSGLVGDEYEPDDSIAQAGMIFPGELQQRVLEPQGEDWVSLQAGVPGFYEVYTEGETIETVLSVRNVETGQEVLRDDGSGRHAGAYVGLYIGTTALVAQISAADPSDPGPYALVFNELELERISPDGARHDIELAETPRYLVLRVLQPGQYTLAIADPTSFPEVSLYNLPNMHREQWEHVDTVKGTWSGFLNPGDYLLRFGTEIVPSAFSVSVARTQQQH